MVVPSAVLVAAVARAPAQAVRVVLPVWAALVAVGALAAVAVADGGGS